MAKKWFGRYVGAVVTVVVIGIVALLLARWLMVSVVPLILVPAYVAGYYSGRIHQRQDAEKPSAPDGRAPYF